MVKVVCRSPFVFFFCWRWLHEILRVTVLNQAELWTERPPFFLSSQSLSMRACWRISDGRFQQPLAVQLPSLSSAIIRLKYRSSEPSISHYPGGTNEAVESAWDPKRLGTTVRVVGITLSRLEAGRQQMIKVGKYVQGEDRVVPCTSYCSGCCLERQGHFGRRS